MINNINDIPNFETFSKIEIINKGWSSDKKYHVETDHGDEILLRISDISEYDSKKYEFDIMKRIAVTGINMSLPIDFGICNNGKSVYQLLKWCEGKEAKELLPSMSQQDQYEFGWKAGQILRKMQSVESYPSSSEWGKIYGIKVKKYIEDYKTCGQTLVGVELLISFLDKHHSCMENRPMRLMHADFQSDNMVISSKKELFIIDFQGSGLVDPYYALGGVMVTAEVSPQFSIGQLHSYFDGCVPTDFWELNAFYMAAECIHAFTVAVTLGNEEIVYSNEMLKTVLEWYDNLNTLVPTWFQSRNNSTQSN